MTSISIGDPLGKPPAAAERVLRVGIDLQAGELVTTGAEDRCHLLFLEGVVRFHTIFPGAYPGRTNHIHFKVHVADHVAHVGQVFFPEETAVSMPVGFGRPG